MRKGDKSKEEIVWKKVSDGTKEEKEDNSLLKMVTEKIVEDAKNQKATK